MTEAMILVVFPLVAAFAAISDLLTMTIPNRVSLVLLAGFFASALLVGMAPTAIVGHVAVGIGVLALGYFCFARGWIGGGDAKFAAVAALWLGPSLGLQFLLLFSLLGGGLTLAVLLLRRSLLPPAAFRLAFVERLYDPKEGVPYGIALAAAALIVYPESVWMKALLATMPA